MKRREIPQQMAGGAMIKPLLTTLVAALLLPLAQASAAPALVSSPDGRTSIRIDDDAGRFTVERRGETVIAPSPLGLELDGVPELGALRLERREDVKVDRTIPLVATKAAQARDRYRGATLVFREQAPAGRRLYLDVRAYDDGVAFRYRLDGAEPVRLRGERTAFVPAGDPDCLASVADGAHEVPFERMKVSQLRAGQAYDVPLVCTAPSGRTAYAITQASLAGYTGAALLPEGGALRIRLSAPPKRPAPAFISQAGLTTAWRVVMMGDRIGDMIPSQLIGNLNPPPQGDFSWVRPGKAAWDWWSGPLAGMKPGMDNYKRFIDFAAASGLPYYLIDAGWASGPGGCCDANPATDVTRAADGIDMPELVRYAAARNVGLMLWAHWEHVAGRMDEVLDTYARWGIKGIKVDFMDRNDQEMVRFYHNLLSKAAAHHLMVDLHGAYPPDGLARTYPNFLTQEGVMGAEYNKWSARVTATHNVTLPFTRMLLGPMDYTPGGFHALSPADFAAQHRSIRPFVQTTRGQAIAMYVVYDSPLAMVADSPDSYVREDGSLTDGADVLTRIPTTWDETRVLMGDIGEYVVTARRKGSTWYIGAMTNETGRMLSVPLAFLGGHGTFAAKVYEDGADLNQLRISERKVTARDRIPLKLAGSGGAVVELAPPGQ